MSAIEVETMTQSIVTNKQLCNYLLMKAHSEEYQITKIKLIFVKENKRFGS